MTIDVIPVNDRIERFTASSGQTVFSFDFPVYEPSDLDVRRFRAGVETPLVNGGDYTVAGAGTQAGGTITLAVPALLGDLIVIRSAQPVARATDFADGGDLPAAALDEEFNRLFVALQQLQGQLAQALRLPPSDPTTAAELATALSRANSVLGFDASGAVELVPRTTIGGGSFQQTGTGSVVRAVQDELRLLSVNPRQFGAVGDGSADDTLALQRAANEAAAQGAVLLIPRGTYRITDTVTFPGAIPVVWQQGLISYNGPAGRAALVVGDGGTAANRCRRYLGLRVERATLATWLDEQDVGIRLRNMDSCLIEVLQAERFTIGVQTFGDGRGFEDSTLILGRLVDNRYHLDVRTNLSTAWNNSVRYIGGHFANSAATWPLLSRFGVRFSRAPGGYNLHNGHFFFGPAFELQNQGFTVDAIPYLVEVNSRSVLAYGIRMEANSDIVARHTAAAADHVYEVAFASNGPYTGPEGDAYLLRMDYPGATRAGGTIVPLHQAAAAQNTTKLIASVDSLRANAFRWTASEVGFERLAVLSANPVGPPTTLNGLAFPGLNLITLAANHIELPTSRAVGFVVRCHLCKEFLIGFDGTNMRPTILQFDASENVLGSGAVALLSNQSLAWNATAQWWQSTADSEDSTYTRLQRVTLASSAALAIIGVGSSQPAGVLRALRLYAPALHHPQVLYGGGRRWGTRELSALAAATDPPSIAAGATHNFNVTLTDARPGDFAQASFGLATVLPFFAQAQSDAVNVRIWNPTGAAVDLAAGDVFVRVIKPRL
jgi:hypothetical protein